MAPYRTILVGVDFTDAGRRAVERAAEFSRLYDAEVHLAHIIEHFPEDLPVGMIPAENRDPQEALTARSREKLSSLAREAGLGSARLVVETTRRSARRHLLALAASIGPDLIVVGGAGETGLGSTASGIVQRAPCDVLVAHAPPSSVGGGE